MSCRRAALALLFGLAATACTPTICSRSSDCNTGLVCTANGRCELPPDAALVDAGTTDDATTPTADAPTADAPTADAPTVDAPTVDAELDDGSL